MSDLEKTSKLLSDIYSPTIRALYEQSLAAQRTWAAKQRRGHQTAPDEADVVSFETWKTRFQEAYETGVKNGWLDIYEDTVDFIPPHGEWVYDETEEEWMKRVGIVHTDKGYITIPIVRRDDASR